MSEPMASMATALLRAQAARDPFAEARAIVPVARAVRAPEKIRTDTPPLQAFLSRVVFGARECWYWTGGIDSSGYGRCARSRYGEVRAHRLAWRLWYGAPPADLKVLHRCDVRSCVNPDHLFLGTQADNVRDMNEKGRGRSVPVCGEANHHSKLTAAQIVELRKTYARAASR